MKKSMSKKLTDFAASLPPMPQKAKDASYYLYGTVAEIYFVRKLGQFSKPGVAMSRLTLLERYREACKLRNRWGTIIKADVFCVIDAEINELRKHGARYV